MKSENYSEEGQPSLTMDEGPWPFLYLASPLDLAKAKYCYVPLGQLLQLSLRVYTEDPKT